MNFYHVLSRRVSIKNYFYNNELGHMTVPFLHTEDEKEKLWQTV